MRPRIGSLYTVVIIDTDEFRRDAICQVCGDAGVDVIPVHESCSSEILGAAAFVLCHGHDVDLLPAGTDWRRVVFYTGGDPEKSEHIPEQALERIWSPLTRSDVPCEGDISAILDYFCASSDSKGGRGRPAVLMPPSFAGTYLLESLAILCQGYLAVHADPRTGLPWFPDEEDVDEKDNKAVAEALKKMEWTKIGNCTGVLSDTIRNPETRENEQRNVRAASWWRSVVGEGDPKLLVEQQWGKSQVDFRPVLDLAQVLREGSDPVNPGLVAAAYLKLAERLAEEYR